MSKSFKSVFFLVLIIVNQIFCDIGIKFTRQPEPIDAPYQDVVEFECGLNIPSEHVEWCHNGKVLPQPPSSGQQNLNGNSKQQESKLSHSLTITLHDYSQVGDYQCIAWYGASAIISTSAKLSLAELKPFPKQPDVTYDVSAGNDIIVSCPSPESKPQAYIQYYKDDNLLTNANLLQTTNSLFIKNANVSDTGVYTCLASNSIAGQDEKSSFQYTVRVSHNNGRSRSPYFLKEPQKKYVVEIGNNISIECNAVGNPKPKTFWSKSNENRLNNRSFDEGTVLTIVNVELGDAGTYTCKADNGVSPTLSVDIELEVQESPQLIREPDTNTINENESIEFECSFKGSPKPKVDWYLNSKLLSNDNNIVMSDGKIRINSVEKKHAGIYQCFGTNVLGSTFGITMLQVSPIQKQIFDSSNDNTYEIKMLMNESSQHHHHGTKKHKTKHHGGKNKSLKENVVMIPPTRPNITRLSDKSVMVRWSVPPNNGLPIQFFKVQYKEIGNKHSRKTNRWMTSNEDIQSHIRSYEIDGLETNQTYRFRIAAVYSNNDNKLSQNSAKFHLHKGSTTNKNRPKPPSLTETEAISPNVIQIHWQYLNSVLSPVDGFYIYYRASTSAGDYIKSTVEGQDVRAYNITHLQPNSQYEIKLQSFTVGAASDFSSILISRTQEDPNAVMPVENTTEITNITPELHPPPGTSSKTYIYTIVGIIIGLLTVISLLYVVINFLRNKPKRSDADDDDSNDNDKTDSLTIPQITDSSSTMNGFVNHSAAHGSLPSNMLANGTVVPNGVPSKINGNISNGYVNKTIVHSNNVTDEDETVNMMSTGASGVPKQSLPARTAHARDLNPLTMNDNAREYETLNMIEGIHEMTPGTRESINIINNPLENNSEYNIELNYLSNMKNNNVNSRNNPRNRNKRIDLECIEYELGNDIGDLGSSSLRMKHKMNSNNNNNNSKIINNNTKYSPTINNNNWRGRSVVDTRRNDNYM